MPLSYQKELDFSLALLGHMRLQALLAPPDIAPSDCDRGLRMLMGMESDYENARRMAERTFRERTIYKVVDAFLCHYIFLRLPRAEHPTILIIGPYLTEDLSANDTMEMAERLGLSLDSLPLLADYYAALPIFHDPSAIFAIVSTLGDVLWPGNGFDTEDIRYEQNALQSTTASVHTPIEEENILLHMQQMEERYAYENRLMEIVAKGQTSQAETLMTGVSRLNYQPRVPDPLRNQKNYCIICNTLLRKAAQQGGVHPIHLDKMSGQFARAIENAPTPDACSALIGEMVRAYCHMVHTLAAGHYSAVVQKAITYIDANLSGDLSLTTLARLLQLAPSYLSGLFHRETGRTLTGHIADERMKAALQLLKTSHLQIQSIAQLCGFSDPNYFSKFFKRRFGVTPLQYRADLHSRPHPPVKEE